jgi:hypothetical protein
MLRVSTVISVVNWMYEVCKDLGAQPQEAGGRAHTPAPPTWDEAEMQANGLIIRRWHAMAFACNHAKRGISKPLRLELERQAKSLATMSCRDQAGTLRLRQYLAYALSIQEDNAAVIKSAFLAVYQLTPHLNPAWRQEIVDDCQTLSRVHPPTRACHALVRQLALNLGVKVRRVRR